MDRSASEETIKTNVRDTYLSEYKYETLGKIDFAIYEEILGDKHYILWAEAKKGVIHDIYESFVQLLLTIGKDRTLAKQSAPKFFGAFDAEKIAFVEYKEFREVFYQNDFNWNVPPSDHYTKEFRQLNSLVRGELEEKSLIFYYGKDDKELREFISKNFVIGKSDTNKILIDINNFPEVFQKWHGDVLPTIDDYSDMDVMPADFFLADLMSIDNMTFSDKLRILLKQYYYQVKDEFIRKKDRFNYQDIEFTDNQKAHKKFWNKYERPPLKEFQKKILDRRDLLVMPDIRERKGSFFTPQIWARLSKEYLKEEFGVNWQEEYYVWDCCAGTGNLLHNLVGYDRVFASTLDHGDVLIMKECLAGKTLPVGHIFQFDFLNDDLQGEKVPENLRNILSDPEKRKRLIIYINPPYAEAANSRQITRTGSNKPGTAIENKTYERYKKEIGVASNELYAQFFIKIYKEIQGCKLAQFSKIKQLQSPNFIKFREVFQARLKKLFLIPSNTFDNVNGKFPIGFFIWNTDEVKIFKKINATVYGYKGEKLGKKKIISYSGYDLINKWYAKYYDNKGRELGIMNTRGNDFQNYNYIRISSDDNHNHTNRITKSNLIVTCIYFSVRHCIKATWLNDRDQFFYPKKGWQNDKEFHSNCLAFTLFHGQNRITSELSTNHWIPFTAKEVGASSGYDSNFMCDFIKGKIKFEKEEMLFEDGVETQGLTSQNGEPISFSPSAQAVMDAGRELWKYYHTQKDANPNASYYDIKVFFQKTNDDGKMNADSKDEEYNRLHDILKEKMNALAEEIEKKVYEYEFLVE